MTTSTSSPTTGAATGAGERTLHVLIPTYKPVGGIVKVFDYVLHARALGYRVSVGCAEEMAPDLPVFDIERMRGLADDPLVEFHARDKVKVGPADLFLVSLPKQYNAAYRDLPAGMTPARIIHIIQNIRHINPTWRLGEGTRILTRPASRISINSIVAEAIAPWLDERGLHHVINLGHESGVFARQRSGPLSQGEGPVRIAYTTWKSDVGERVAGLMRHDPRVEFRAIRETVSWEELTELYHWADVFLGTPHREEGMYLPGLEAMAAGNVVVLPDAGGNMAYSRPGENCLLVDFESAPSYVAAIEELLAMPAEQVDRLRQGGYAVLPDFDLEHERAGFAEFLDRLWEHVARLEQTPAEAEE